MGIMDDFTSIMEIEDIKESSMTHSGKAVEFLRNIKRTIFEIEVLHGKGYNPCVVDDMVDILELAREEFRLSRIEDYDIR